MVSRFTAWDAKANKKNTIVTCASIFEISMSGTIVSPPSLDTVSAIASACEPGAPSNCARNAISSSSLAFSAVDASSN